MKFVRRVGAPCWTHAALVAVPVLLASTALAASEGEYREHDAHEHGHGTLDIVVEGAALVAELRIPSVNVVGFEHAPRDDAEREAVRRALVPFMDAASVLVPSAQAQCEVEEAEAVIASMDREEHHDGDESGEGEESEGEGHDEAETEAETETGEQAEGSGAEAHSELHASYHFRCAAPDRLVRIEVRVFEHLHDAEELEVRVVTPDAQMAMEVHPGEAVIELSR